MSEKVYEMPPIGKLIAAIEAGRDTLRQVYGDGEGSPAAHSIAILNQFIDYHSFTHNADDTDDDEPSAAE